MEEDMVRASWVGTMALMSTMVIGKKTFLMVLGSKNFQMETLMKVSRSKEKDAGEVHINFQKMKTKGAYTTMGNGKMMFLMEMVKRLCRTELIRANG